MKKITVLLLVLLVFSLAGCKNVFPPYDVSFANNSSRSVAVIGLKDGNPSDFTLSSNTTMSVKINGSEINFSYTPANLVSGSIDSKKYEVTFTDK